MDFDRLKTLINAEFTSVFQMKDFNESLDTVSKDDKSPLTKIDLRISELFEKACSEKKILLISEENTHRKMEFPFAVLDPIDGTRELVKGWPECAVSYAFLKDPIIGHKLNRAWIYNPFTGLDMRSDGVFCHAPARRKKDLLGLVSQTEFTDKLFDDLSGKFLFLSPRGSIANKLAILASGGCDFVLSRRPKNLWDIAAGTELCQQRGIHFYVNGKRHDRWIDLQISGEELLWVHPEQYHCVRDLLQK